jgi:transposase InsO family protein
VESGLLPSMRAIGDCYDNAMIESFWSRMQVELLDRQRWETRVQLANAMFDYVEIFHNRKRRHSALGMLTPIEYELQRASQTAAESSRLAPRNSGHTTSDNPEAVHRA